MCVCLLPGLLQIAFGSHVCIYVCVIAEKMLLLMHEEANKLPIVPNDGPYLPTLELKTVKPNLW